MHNENIYTEEDLKTNDDIQYLPDEEIQQISEQLIEQYHDVYEVLASWFILTKSKSSNFTTGL